MNSSISLSPIVTVTKRVTILFVTSSSYVKALGRLNFPVLNTLLTSESHPTSKEIVKSSILSDAWSQAVRSPVSLFPQLCAILRQSEKQKWQTARRAMYPHAHFHRLQSYSENPLINKTVPTAAADFKTFTNFPKLYCSTLGGSCMIQADSFTRLCWKIKSWAVDLH